MNDYAIVYMRPDGWWSAGTGFESIEAAREVGKAHEWNGSRWAIIPSNQLVDIEGDLRLPLNITVISEKS